VKDLNDAALIEYSYRDNNQRAYAELVTRHQSALRYSMRQLCNWDEALADDLVQEAFIQAFKKLHTYKNQAKFSSWLYRIAYNIFLQHHRKPKLNLFSFDDSEFEIQSADLSQEMPQHEDLSVHKKLAKLLSTLKPQRRSVLHLYLHRQCTQSEIATMMGLPLGSVKTHILRGRQDLQKVLKAWNDE